MGISNALRSWGEGARTLEKKRPDYWGKRETLASREGRTGNLHAYPEGKLENEKGKDSPRGFEFGQRTEREQ